MVDPFVQSSIDAWLRRRVGALSPAVTRVAPNTSTALLGSNLANYQLAQLQRGLDGALGFAFGIADTLKNLEHAPDFATRFARLNAEDQEFLRDTGELDQWRMMASGSKGPFGIGTPRINIRQDLVERAKRGRPWAQRYLKLVATLFPQQEYPYHYVKGGLLSQLVGEPFGELFEASAKAGDILVSPISAAVATGGKALFEEELPNPVEVWKQAAFRDHPGTGLAYAIAEAFGGRETMTADQYDSMIATTSFITQWYTDPTVVAGKVSHGFRLAERILAGAPMQGVSRSLITQKAYEAAYRAPEQLLASKRGKGIAQEIAQTIGTVESGSELGRRFANLPPRLRSALVGAKGAGPDDVRELLLAWTYGEGASDIKLLKTRRAEVLSQLDEANRVTDPGRFDRIDQLDLQRRIIDGKLNAKLTPTFEPLERVPKTSALYRIAHQGATTPGERFLSGLFHGHIPAPIYSKSATYERINDLENEAARLRFELSALNNRARFVDRETVMPEINRVSKELDPVLEELANLEARAGKRTLEWVKMSPSISKVRDKLWGNEWWVHTSPTERMPPDALSRTMKDWESLMKYADVPVPQRNAVLDELANAKSDADWFRAMTKMGSAIGESPSIPLSQKKVPGKISLSALQKQQINTFVDSISDDRKYGVIPYREPTPGGGYRLRDDPTVPGLGPEGETISLPGGPEEFIGFIPAVPVESMIEARAYGRRVLRAMEQAGGPLWGTAKALRGLHRVNTAATQFWRDSIILSRSLLGAFQIRVIGEENVRMWAADKASILTPGDYFGYVKQRADMPKWLTGDFLGQISSQIKRDLAERPVKKWYRGSDPYRAGPEAGFIEALSARHAQLHTNPLVRKLAVAGPEEGTKWLLGREGWELRRQLTDVVERHRLWLEKTKGVAATTDDALRSYVDRKWRELQAVTDGHPRALASISTGHAVAPESAGLQAERERLLVRVEELNDRYYQPGPVSDIQDITRDIREARDQIRELDGYLRSPYRPVELGTPEHAQWLGKLSDEMNIKDMLVSGYSRELRKVKVDRSIRTWMYEHLVSNRDLKYARRPLLNQLYDSEKQRLLSLGWPEKVADSRAWVHAANGTADFLYDLATRTSAQRFFRNFAPFAPAWQETLETYLWKIPAEYGAGIGHLYLARQASLAAEFTDRIGIDFSKARSIPVLGRFISWAMGLPVPTNLTYRPENLNMVTGAGFMPGLGPVSGAALSGVSRYLPVLDSLANRLLPYGPDIQLGPGSVNRLYEAVTGQPAPWEVGSKDMQETMWQYSLDTATNQTFIQMRKTLPKPKDFVPSGDLSDATEDQRLAYQEAVQAWLGELEQKAKTRARVWSLTRGLASMAWPAAVGVTDDANEEYKQIYSKLLELAGIAEGTPIPPGSTLDERFEAAQRSVQGQALYSNFLQRFPGGDMYLAPRRLKRLGSATLKAQETDNEFYNRRLGEQYDILDQEDRGWLSLYLMSYRLHQARLDTILNEAGGTGSPAQKAARIIGRWGSYRDTLRVERRDWDAYVAFNTRGDALFKRMIQAGKDKGESPGFTVDQERLVRILVLLDEVRPLLEEGGEKPEGYSDIRRAIMQELESQRAEFGESRNPILREVEWYFTNVGDKYFAGQSALYDKVARTERDKQSPIREQIRQLADAQKPVTHNGVTFPTPEEFSWSNKTTDEQKEAQTRWATGKIEWLTRFQRKELGWDKPGADEFFSLVNQTNSSLISFGAKVGFSTKEYLNKKDEVEKGLKSAAVRFRVADLWARATQPPFQRLVDTGFGGNAFRKLSAQMQMTWDYIDSQGFRPWGESELARQVRASVFRYVGQLRRADPEFDDDMYSLERALAPRGYALRPGADMYKAIFFNDWGR